MLVTIVVVVTAVLEIGVKITHLAFGISKFVRLRSTLFRVLPCKQDKRSNSRAQRTHTAHQQHKNVEQASASSGNQCVPGHRSVPRFELFASDDSTNGGRTMISVLARLASATIPVFELEKQHANRA